MSHETAFVLFLLTGSIAVLILLERLPIKIATSYVNLLSVIYTISSLLKNRAPLNPCFGKGLKFWHENCFFFGEIMKSLN